MPVFGGTNESFLNHSILKTKAVLTFPALNLWVTAVSCRTVAERSVVHHNTLCIDAAVAGADAVRVVAGVLQVAVVVVSATDYNRLGWKEMINQNHRLAIEKS